MRTFFAILIVLAMLLASCQKKEEIVEEKNMKSDETKLIEERIAAFAPIDINADVSMLNDNQLKVLEYVIKAGQVIDEIFWQQSAPCAIPTRDSLMKLDDVASGIALKYVMLNYGPYDPIFDNGRFLGNGPAKRPEAGGFYPLDMTKEEFDKFIAANPDKKELFTSQYTVITRENGSLKAIPYHKYYKTIENAALFLDTAATYAENPSLKKYIELRAKALRTDEYYDSDIAWMDLENNDIDFVLGPIENYEDGLYNYKTAFEAIVMVKDIEASKELDLFHRNLKQLESKIPYTGKPYKKGAPSKTVLQIVNVAYFGGDCNKGVKTIANSLPNDPKIHESKGSKKSMFKNMMEAKFEKIVVPIANAILTEEFAKNADKKAFTSFVTLHEISHTFGPGYVIGSKESVRVALKERYSAVEETKADILGMYNHKTLLEIGAVDQTYIDKAMATYLAGLYRSIRFGAEEAHGRSNLIQLNFLKQNGAIVKQKDGKLAINKDIFFDKVAELADMILTIQANGDYAKAGEIIEKYGQITPEIKAEIELLSVIPRDIDCKYNLSNIFK